MMFSAALFVRSWRQKSQQSIQSRDSNNNQNFDQEEEEEEDEIEEIQNQQKLQDTSLHQNHGAQDVQIHLIIKSIGLNEKRGAVLYKDDKDRFTKRYSLKLGTCSTYEITLECKPSPSDNISRNDAHMVHQDATHG